MKIKGKGVVYENIPGEEFHFNPQHHLQSNKTVCSDKMKVSELV